MMRTDLEAKTERERSVQDYKQLIIAYRHVYLITAHAAEVPQALKEVGDLYRRMGEQFENSYFNSAVETYEFLLHEYPTSRYREDALLAIAEIEKKRQSERAQSGGRGLQRFSDEVSAFGACRGREEGFSGDARC